MKLTVGGVWAQRMRWLSPSAWRLRSPYSNPVCRVVIAQYVAEMEFGSCCWRGSLEKEKVCMKRIEYQIVLAL
jgi:hypothetical protein